VMSLSVKGFAVYMIYLKINWLLSREGRRGGLEVEVEALGVGGGYGRGV